MEAASRSLACISSAVNDLQLLENLCANAKSPDWEDDLEELKTAKMALEMGCKTFLLCARKWLDKEDDSVASTLGELVIATEGGFSSVAQTIHNCYLTSLEDGNISASLSKEDDEFFGDLNDKMKPWISVFYDCSSRRCASDYSLVKKPDLIEFMDSILEILGRMRHFFVVDDEDGHDEYEYVLSGALQEVMMFLRNFICFVTLDDSLEDIQLGPLFNHAEFVTFSAASLSMADILEFDENTFKGSISDLQQKIIHVQPQVHETCVQALIASKLSPQSCLESINEELLRGFVDSLLFYLWASNEICLMVSLLDQLQMLWDGLISLRTVLKVGNPKLDDKTRHLTRLVLCDAGLVLFSLSFSAIKHGSVKDIDLMSFGDFVERLEFIKATTGENCPETSSSNFPKTNMLGFLDSLLKHMMDLASSQDHVRSLAFVNDKLQTIREELDFLRSNILEKIVTMRHEDEELQALWDRVAEVAYKAEFRIDSLLIGDIPDSFPMLFDSILEEIQIIKVDASKILETKELDLKAMEIIKRSSHIPSLGSKPMINNMVLGLEDATTSIINRLKRGSSHLEIIPIVGMPGLGKTTLANKIFNDSQVESHFYKRAWVTVSQQYHKKRLLLEILTSTHSKLPSDISEKREEDLALEVRKSLQRARYLIVLDDVWSTEVWDDFGAIFPDNKNGSRLLLTSRRHDLVASGGELSEGPHYLRPLTDNESWDLLKKMLYPGKKDLPSAKLCELRMQIVEMCRGVPLTIVILAGILANEDQTCWERVLERLNSSLISSTAQLTATLELSYQNLPDNLKPCFLYFGVFPEDHEHIIDDLICQWIGEGFVQEDQFKSMEDVANDYMKDLICRSLVIASKQRYMDGVESCRVHDLLHEFCVKKGRGEFFASHARA